MAAVAEQQQQLIDEQAKAREEFESQLEVEQQNRLRVIDEAVEQRTNEWAERQAQLEHELVVGTKTA